MEFTIRHVEAGDVAKVFGLWKKLIQEQVNTFEDGSVYPELDLDDDHTLPEWFKTFSEALTNPNSRFWVAIADGQIVGFLVAYHFERLSGNPSQLIHVGDMFVDKPFRKHFTLAKLLEAEVELWAAELRVEAIECNAVATPKQINKWVRKGFTPYQVTLYRAAKWKEKM